MEELYKYLRNNKFVSLFIDSGNVTLDLLTNHLNILTLQFKNKDLERHYYSFINEEAVPYTTVGLVFVAILYLVYIPLDTAYDKFIPLLLSRTISGAVLLLAVVCIVFSRFCRNHCVHMMTFILCGVSITAMLSLIFRDDVGFAPLFMVLLVGNLHCAAFAWHRAISGLLQILLQALVWIFVLKKDAGNFLLTQTLSYVLFYISAILASYMRELAHRRVYFIIHQMLNSHELKHYSMMLSSSAQSLAHKSRATKRLSVAPRFDVSPPPPASPDPLLSSLGISSELTTSPQPVLPNLASSSGSEISAPASPTLSSSTSSFLPPSLTPSSEKVHQQPPIAAALQTSYSGVIEHLSQILSICIPPRGDAEMSEIGYHRAVYLYVRKLQHPVTQRFRDALRETKFQAWHVEDTVLSLRRFLLLNIISIACLTTHDFTSFPFERSQTHVLLIIRFCAIIPCIFLSFMTSMLRPLRNWRGMIITTLEICCSVAALSMGLYAWYHLRDRVEKPVMAYDLYFGYVIRFVVYCFCGMGLLWMQSTFIAAAMLAVMFVTTSLLGVPLALSPLIIIVIGFVISFYDERTRRTEFFLIQYRDEVLTYIRAKEQYETPMAVHAKVSLSNLADFS